MEGKSFFLILISILLVIFLIVYWFIPFNTLEFNVGPVNSNFSLSTIENQNLQFYPNMRFPDKEISYRIEGCSLQRQDDMKRAFEIMESKTSLSFYPVAYGEEIIITCEDTLQYEGNLFVAGEGGPTNITVSGNFNIIYSGKVLLLRDSQCPNPNIALHELLHVLGFAHSTNPNNIMYEISACRQEMSSDMIEFIEDIYSVQAQPDLLFENVTATLHGKYIDANFSVRNNGIKHSGASTIKILANGKEIKEIELAPVEVGYGRKISLTNLWVSQISINELEFNIETNFEELDKSNNVVFLEIKK